MKLDTLEDMEMYAAETFIRLELAKANKEEVQEIGLINFFRIHELRITKKCFTCNHWDRRFTTLVNCIEQNLRFFWKEAPEQCSLYSPFTKEASCHTLENAKRGCSLGCSRGRCDG